LPDNHGTQSSSVSRVPLWLILSGAGAAFLLAATVIVGLYLGNQTRERFVDIGQSWQSYSDEAERRGALLSRIRELLGYGGIIHNFKNYVIRQEPSYLVTLQAQLEEFTQTVAGYRAAGATPLEQQSLTAIEQTIAIYASKIPLAVQAAQERWPVARTDVLVKVDDSAAIEGLAALDRFWRDQRRATVSTIENAVGRGEALIARGFAFLAALAVVAMVLYALFFLLQRELRLTIVQLSDELHERLAAEHAIKKFQRAVDQSPATILITDTAARIEYVNRAFCEVTGYDLSEILGQTPRFLQSGDQSPEKYAAIRARLENGEDWRGTFRNIKKNGEAYWASTVLLPLRDETGTITNFIGIGEDITERRKARDQINRAQKMEAVGLLASGVAHDFNNILTTIIGNVFLARQESDAGSHHADELEQIDIAAKRARNLVSQILTFARRQPGEVAPISVGQAMTEVARLLRASIPPSISIETRLPDTDLHVLADPTRLHQVIMNLASNAAEVVDLTTGCVTIAARREQDDPALVQIVVTDNGSGVPQDIRERVFEPFFSTKPAGKGTGLGLAVVANLTADMGGTIALEPAQDGASGATFTISLPATEAVAAADIPDKPAIDGQGRILLVDDEPDVVETCAKVLRRLGYEVDATTSPHEALDRFEANPDAFALVMTDFVMPQINGQEVCETVRGIRPDCPLIVYSGYQPATLDMDRLKPIRLLEKPIDPVQLSVVVHRMLLRVAPD
jgi:PAS domain S-box-containing protein